jgi:hypothetical protein
MRTGGDVEEFIDRMLKERRTLHEALADLLATHNRIPSNSQRSALRRMIEGLKAEIALRNATAISTAK